MTLSSYLTSLVLVASVCALTAALAPEGSNKKYLHLLASVAVLVALISPLSQLDLSFDAEGQEPLPRLMTGLKTTISGVISATGSSVILPV